MASYFVHKIAQANGDHEVHVSGCSYMPSGENRIALGDFVSCAPAVSKAHEHYRQVNGCFYCSRPCHTQ